jgi:RepB plasmid partitioning protein/ParB-like nuclease domain
VTEKRIDSAFAGYIITIPMSCIVTQREPTPAMRTKGRYKQIAASLEHIGLIEPLVVFEQPHGTFLLVDGNTRFAILKSRGVSEVACIIAKDDEAYTYNRRVSHVPPLAQHFMLLRVLESGVSEERIATALNVDIRSVRRKRDLLKDICPDAVKLLENRRLNVRGFSALRRMKPLRQIEAVEHMISSNNFTLPFIKAILHITKREMLCDTESRSVHEGPARSLLEREHEGLVRDLKAVENSFGVDMLTLAVSLKYLERLMRNAKVNSYLETACSEIFVLLIGLLQETRTGEPNAA